MSSSNIRIEKNQVEYQAEALSKLVSRDIIDSARQSKNQILNAVENSSGDFIRVFQETVIKEEEVMEETGQFLIAVLEYVKSASRAFVELDEKYRTDKVELEVH